MIEEKYVDLNLLLVSCLYFANQVDMKTPFSFTPTGSQVTLKACQARSKREAIAG